MKSSLLGPMLGGLAIVAAVAAGLADHTLADMDQNLATVPTGLATIE